MTVQQTVLNDWRSCRDYVCGELDSGFEGPLYLEPLSMNRFTTALVGTSCIISSKTTWFCSLYCCICSWSIIRDELLTAGVVTELRFPPMLEKRPDCWTVTQNLKEKKPDLSVLNLLMNTPCEILCFTNEAFRNGMACNQTFPCQTALNTFLTNLIDLKEWNFIPR